MFNKTIAVIGALLCGVAVSQAVEDRITLKPGPEGVDKWYGSYYNKQGVDNDILRVGGYGDYYNTLIKFDGVDQSLPGAFKRGELWFYRINLTRPTNMNVWLLTSRWSEALWDHANLTGYYLGEYGGPAVGSGWYPIDMTPSVNYWRQNPSLNYGWFFAPAANDNRYDEFHSSDSASVSLRPELRLFYDLDFKMPLPGGKTWKLTVEAGGRSNDFEQDKNHTWATYYSLDFSPWCVQIGEMGNTIHLETDVPILAMAGGRVYAVWSDDPNKNANGYHVRIDHGNDNNSMTGFQTVYCHLKSPPLVQQGQTVVQGQKLGIMGTTGQDSSGRPTSTGIHLHVTFYYQGTAVGNGTDPQLDQVRMEGRLLKDYKLNPQNPTIPRLYPSSNVMK